MFKELILTILSALYSFAILLRNRLFDWGVLKSKEYDVPIICIGNITVGGTGKTPMTEMIVSYMSKNHRIAVLSRGYKRRTKGYIEVEEDSHYRDVGDEPLQIKLKFPECVMVVCEDRAMAIDTILEKHPEVNLIIMDDGFQHRYVTPKVSVIMVDATRPPHEDHMMPLGRLRDSIDSLHRAHYFIVTKCPENMTPLDRMLLNNQLKTIAYQEIYYTRLESFKPTAIFAEGVGREVRPNCEVIALSGIGNPTPFISSLESNYRLVDSIIYDDHHIYKVKDMSHIVDVLAAHPNAVIITTEKDAVKMSRSQKIPLEIRERIFYIPINISFIDDSTADFLKKLQEDVIGN